jgi:alpha-glucuronidase
MNFWANGRKGPSTIEIYKNGPWDFQNLENIKMVLGNMKLGNSGLFYKFWKITSLTP